MIETVSMDIERGRGITTQDAARSPVAISRRRKRVLIADVSDVDILDQSDAMGAGLGLTAQDVIGRGDQPPHRTGVSTVETNAAQRPYVSHPGKQRPAAGSQHPTERKWLFGRTKMPHPSMRGLSYPRGPDMIMHVTMLGPAWHARPDPGEPGRVIRRSYSDGHLAGGTVAHATDLADDLLLRNCADYLARHSQYRTGR
jgi:hypothetical protein